MVLYRASIRRAVPFILRKSLSCWRLLSGVEPLERFEECLWWVETETTVARALLLFGPVLLFCDACGSWFITSVLYRRLLCCPYRLNPRDLRRPERLDFPAWWGWWWGEATTLIAGATFSLPIKVINCLFRPLCLQDCCREYYHFYSSLVALIEMLHIRQGSAEWLLSMQYCVFLHQEEWILSIYRWRVPSHVTHRVQNHSIVPLFTALLSNIMRTFFPAAWNQLFLVLHLQLSRQ